MNLKQLKHLKIALELSAIFAVGSYAFIFDYGKPMVGIMMVVPFFVIAGIAIYHKYKKN